MPLALQAGLWGLLSGSALVLGALLAYIAKIPPRLLAGVMAFGAGVLISALSFELMDEGFHTGGLPAVSFGFVVGAGVFSGVNYLLARAGAKHRKRSGEQQSESGGSGLAIAVGALLDGIPESIVIGISLIGGGGVSVAAVAAVFLSNLPEGMCSAAGMREAGRSRTYVFGVWIAIALASAIAALLGNLLLADASPLLVAFVNALAAGAILAMLVDTMIPEAFAVAHDFAGLVTVGGFLSAFWLSKAAG